MTLYNPETMTVLIVDDHDPIRKAIKRVLNTMNFGEAIECFDGEDALEVLQKKPVDLLILDLYMRNVSGFQVLEHVRGRDIGGDIPVIIVTGEGGKEEIVKVADMGAEDYVLKPFHADDLEKKITTVLNQYYSPTPLLKALRQAERYFMAGEYEKALSDFEKARSIDPDSARAAHGKAKALERCGQSEEAVSLLEETISKNPSYYRNYAALADLHISGQRNRDAIEAMKRELEINPKQSGRQITLARLLQKEGDIMGAMEHYREALKEEPKKRAALMGMGHALARAENLDKALYYFKRVRRYHPGATKALESAVKHALAAGAPKKAEHHLRDEKASNPDRKDTYIVLAMFYFHQEREDDGLQVLAELLKRDPDNARALRMRGLMYLKKKQWTKAAEDLRHLAKQSPSPEVLAALGESELALGQTSEAMNSLTRSLTMDPEHPQSIFLLARCFQQARQWMKAYYLYRKAGRFEAYREQSRKEAQNCFHTVMSRRQPSRAS